MARHLPLPTLTCYNTNMKASHLHLAYGTKIIYDDCNFHFEAGDKVGVIGVNGAGKTTLFRIILGEQQLDDGEINLPELRLGYLRRKSSSRPSTLISPSGITLPLVAPSTTSRTSSTKNTRNSPNTPIAPLSSIASPNSKTSLIATISPISTTNY